MLVENACFKLDADSRFFSCHDGLFEDGQYIDTSTSQGATQECHRVVATISHGSAGKAPDFLYAFPYRCLSERALELFQKEQFNVWPAIRWVPVTVMRKSGKVVAPYWWARFDRRIEFDAFDYDHSNLHRDSARSISNTTRARRGRV